MKAVFEKKEYFGLHGSRIAGFRSFAPMFHPHGELLCVVKGELRLVVEGEEVVLREGEMTVIFPYLVHSYEKAPEAEVLLVLFDPGQTSFDRTLLAKRPLSPVVSGEEMIPLLERLVHWSRRARLKTALGYLNAVLGEYLEKVTLSSADRRNESTSVRVLEYCSEHFAENVTVKDVAEALYVSQSYVSKIFSDQLRCGFREYLNSLRIQKAKSLLVNSDKRIVEIMLDCGFQNQSSFNRVFRSLCGISPGEYQRRARLGELEPTLEL
ncbi:MAG: helix-turn-helix transcriptional regulator [Clostridia bacterium]|nr:helix-turn-helix transcriptional regulator [Clostridia bacterium]